MKAMLLAAGEGRRMRPLTLATPKPLLPLAGRPILEHTIAKLAAAGITELVINVSWLGEQLIDYFGSGEQLGVTIEWSRERQPLETAGAVINALELLGDAPFLLINGDVWSDYPLAVLAARGAALAASDQLADLVMVDNPIHHPSGDFALRDGRLAVADDGRLTFSGISLWRPEPFASAAVVAGEPLALRDLLLPLLAAGRVNGEHWGGSWCDVGTPQRYAALDAELNAARLA